MLKIVRRLFVVVPWLVFVGLVVAEMDVAALASAADKPKHPNILLIVGDDMGYADVGFHGCKDIPTPHLDALAAGGARFTNGYVTGPYCSPTRAGLLTGRYQQRFGHEFNPSGSQGLPLSEVTLADRLKSAGYVTGLIGKWHLGGAAELQPQKRGFDDFFGFLEGAHDYFASAGIKRGEQQIQEKEYLTDALAREAVNFIERHKTKPWFLYLAFNAVHTPMQADDARLAKFASITDKTRRTYAAMMFAMDEAIGRIRKAVADRGLEQDTLVFFISDNGGPTMPGTTQNGSINAPLRGSKRTTLEGGIRVPFIVHWPGKIKPSIQDQPAIQTDLHVTALKAADIEPQSDWKLDGVDLMPYLSGAKSGPIHDALFWRFGNQMAIRVGDYKLVRYDGNADTQTGKPNQPVSATKLYRLSDDRGEEKDLSTSMPDKVKELQTKWDAWNATLVRPLWGGGGKAPEAGGENAPPKKRRKKAD